MTDPDSLLAGALAGRYQLLRLLGEGGMARVHLALDIKHNREVALKVLRPELVASLGPTRFQREIETAARLQHPHILTVFDSGNADGVLWFTMPYVDGESLRARLARERQLSVDEAIRITREAAQALQYAHDHGVIHRDIKPDNILLTRDGNTLVADFGIARGLAPGEEAAPITQTGMSVGTPAYMSPEQASGDRVIDARTDVYALGAVLYEMLTGEPPFTGPTPEAIIAKRFTLPVPSVRTTRGTVTPATDQVIARALALVPGDRFATAAEFSATLAATAPTLSGPTVATPRPANRHRALIVAIAALLLLGSAGFFAWRRGTGNEPAAATLPTTPRIAVLPFENRGDTSDAYFADGMTDAVRGKLSQLPGVEVVARTSTSPYLGSPKTPTEIARELGAQYLLTAVVRFDRRSGDVGIVHLTPELVEVTPNGTPTTRWQQSFDHPLTDVFEVQGQIAEQVASRMRVALASGTNAALAQAPTNNPRAYDAFLRGEALREQMDIGGNREALRHLETAVTLDSTFGDAWAALATARINIAATGINTAVGEAEARSIRTDIDKALRFAPNSSRPYRALGAYYRLIEGDLNRAQSAYDEGFRRDPNDAFSLSSGALLNLSRGEFEQALAKMQVVVRIDPRQGIHYTRLATAYAGLGRFEEAEEAARRATALAPGLPVHVASLVSIVISEGDLEKARQIVRDAGREMPPEPLFSYITVYGDYVWVLDSAAQETAMSAPLVHFESDPATRDMVKAQIYYLRGDSTRMRIWADSAVRHYNDFLRRHPEDLQASSLRMLATAYAGQTAAARSAITTVGQAAAALSGVDYNGYGAYATHLMARTYIVLGDYDRAITTLTPLVGLPTYEMTKARLRIDPNFDPLRGNPKFEALIR